MSDQLLYETGDNVPKGIYVCASCQDQNSIVFVEKDGTVLKLCPVCQSTVWAKV